MHTACRELLCLLYGRCTLHTFRFHHHRLDRFNALVHVFYTKIHRRIRNARTSILAARSEGGYSIVLLELLHEVLVAQNEIIEIDIHYRVRCRFLR